MGPREWMPGFRELHTTLTAHEEEHLKEIEGKFLPSAVDGAEDARWLCAMIRQLTEHGPFDFGFPKFAALMNRYIANPVCYAIAFRVDESIGQFSKVHAEASKAIPLSYTVHCPVTDALMVVRPWIRLRAGSEKEAFDTLRAGEWTLTQDGEVIAKDRVERILVGPDNRLLCKTQYRFPEAQAGLPKNVFSAIGLDGGHTGDPTTSYGVFFANQTVLSMNLELPEAPKEPISLCTGLVAAYYTTRSS